MAVTSYGVNHNLAVKLWSKKLFREALKQTYAYKFIGESSDSLIQVARDTQKGPGDRIRVGLRTQLTGSGVGGDGTLEGNEEALQTYTDDVLVDQLRHAVRSAGKMSEQRIPFEVREEARLSLTDWWSDRIDTAIFNQLGGNTGQTDTRYTGSNATVAPDASHIIYGGTATTEADVASNTASSIITLAKLDVAIEKAKTLTNPIRPIKVNGEDYYVCFIHPYQEYDLRRSTNTGDWLDIQKAALQGGDVKNNPIFTGALGVYNNVILHTSTRVPSVTANVRRAVFCGAQAACIAFGQGHDQGRPQWSEELFDYGNQLGVEAGLIYGVKKTVFNSADFATIVIATYAVAH